MAQSSFCWPGDKSSIDCDSLAKIWAKDLFSWKCFGNFAVKGASGIAKGGEILSLQLETVYLVHNIPYLPRASAILLSSDPNNCLQLHVCDCGHLF